jgi:hypothetical protein
MMDPFKVRGAVGFATWPLPVHEQYACPAICFCSLTHSLRDIPKGKKNPEKTRSWNAAAQFVV